MRWRLAQLLEIKWWSRYLSEKDPDDYLKWKKEYWKQLIEELSNSLTINPGDKILDAGCGPAGVFIALDANQVVAIDPLLEKYQSLPHFRPSHYPDVSFKTGTIESLNFLKEFDTVFCLNAINHVSDIHVAYDKICNAVKPGGHLVVSIDAHNHAVLKKIFRLLPGDVLHPHQYDLTEYEQFLTTRGFRIKQTLLKETGKIFNYYVQVAERTG